MKKIEYRHPYINKVKISGEKTELPFELQKYFIINNFNYFYLIDYFLNFTNKQFKKKCGADIIIFFLGYLDKHIDEDIELSAEGNFAEEFTECVKLVCENKKHNLTIKKIKPNRNFFAKIKINLFHKPFILRNLIKSRLIIRYLLGLIRRIIRKTNKNDAEVVFLSNIRFSKRNEHNNSLFGSLIKKLDEEKVKNKVIRYDPPRYYFELKRFLKEFLFQKQSYIGDYYNLSHFFKMRKNMKLFKRKWRMIKKDKILQEKFIYKGHNYYNIIKPRLELVFKAISYFASDNKLITEQIIKKEKNKVVVIDSESSLNGKGFMLNLKNKKGKVVALSHELIYPGCVHNCSKNNLIKDKNSIFWRPLPEIKCVWGEYAKNVLLENCNYNEKLIRITGNPKFDQLFTRKFDNQSIIQKYYLNKGKKKILIASNRSWQFVLFVSEILAKTNKYDIILKLHPKEDVNIIKKYFKNLDVKVIEGSADIYELIHVSDFVITERSSVGFEAILLGKIAFILKKDNLTTGGIPYTQYKAAIEIKSAKDLLIELEKLKDENYKKEKLKNIKYFTDYINFGNDGKASERVFSEIKNLI